MIYTAKTPQEEMSERIQKPKISSIIEMCYYEQRVLDLLNEK